MAIGKYKVGDIIKLETFRHFSGNIELIWDNICLSYERLFRINLEIVLIQKSNYSYSFYYIVLVTSPLIESWTTKNTVISLTKEEKKFLDKNYPNGKFWRIASEKVILGLHEKCFCKYAK